MRAQPEQQAPPVQKIRVRYAKRGRMRFTSHRDFSRAFERALLRAGLPMAYSSGFNPHPRISYAGAAPTGSASEAEYLEIGLREVTGLDSVREQIDQALPDGLDVLAVVEAAPGALADLMQASEWLIKADTPPGPEAEAAVTAFLAAESIPVQRMTKKGLRDFDCRAAVLAMVVDPESEAIRLQLRHGEPMVRPDDVLRGLAEVAGYRLERAPLLTRVAQGTWDGEARQIGDPFAT